MDSTYDVVIIGGGPAGYRAAETLGNLGRKVLLVEGALLGGTCLNVGCVPTKTLLNSAKLYVHALEGERFGVKAESVSFDLGKMMAWKREVVDKLRAGIAAEMKHAKVEVVAGSATIVSPGRVSIALLESPAGQGSAANTVGCRAILACTGSSPMMPPIPGLRDNPLVLDSTGILEVTAVPKRLCVIGGGVIGVEFASLFSSLGSQVTVVEMMDEIVPFMDADLAPVLRRAMPAIKWKLGCKVTSVDKGPGEGATVRYTTKDGAAEAVEADLILAAIGRRPNTEGWGADKIGLDRSPKGVAADARMRTNVPGIWAAGDLVGKSQLAHSAYRMAEVAAADIDAVLSTDATHGQGSAGGAQLMRWDAIPWAVYSLPEAAGVGMTEKEATSRGFTVKCARIPLRASGRFAAENGFQAQGAVKLVSDAATGRILGLHGVGSYASEAIWGGAALIEQEMRIKDLVELVLPHPTVWELVRDAARQIANKS
jgi:dihydrolipoamide dehydrogenase